MNRYKPHIYLIPEDDADRQIANGFVNHYSVNDRQIKVLPEAGGWCSVRDTFMNDYIQTLKSSQNAHLVMLIDFAHSWARVAPTSFPVNADGNTVVLHRLTSYNRKALWDGVKAWFDGGPAVSGAIDPAGASVQTLRPNGGSTWQIFAENTPKEKKAAMDWSSFATPIAPDPTTYGYKWNEQLVKKVESPGGARVVLPEYFRLQEDGKKWVAAKPDEVPAKSGLADLRFDPPVEKAPEPYDTPQAPDSAFKKPGPAAGPFQAHLGDGSVVTYCWYRFADQPALLNADLTPEEREKMQVKVERIHRAWTKDRDYLAPPTVGKLADLDPAQLVTPPKGLEIGYVPIATRQEQDASRSGKQESR